MKTIIFAAGLGTRLKPFTLNHPKALVPVGGVPMLRRVIERLKAVGITEMVVNVHHFAHQIVDYLAENQNFGVDIHISDESDQLLDTGGGVLAARRWLDDDDFVMHNADILTDADILEMASRHKASSALATLLVAPRDTSRYLLFDAEMRMHGWTNVKTSEVRPHGLDATLFAPLAFGGVHIASPRIFDLLERYAATIVQGGQASSLQMPSEHHAAHASSVPKFSITDFYIDACRDHVITGYVPAPDSHWFDVGKPESLARAELSIK